VTVIVARLRRICDDVRILKMQMKELEYIKRDVAFLVKKFAEKPICDYCNHIIDFGNVKDEHCRCRGGETCKNIVCPMELLVLNHEKSAFCRSCNEVKKDYNK